MMLVCLKSRILLLRGYILLYLDRTWDKHKNRDEALYNGTLEQNINSETTGSTNKIFNWFVQAFVPNIRTITAEFWDRDIDCRLVALFDNENTIFRGEEFFVSRIRTSAQKKRNPESDILLKLSKEAVEMFLEDVFGSNNEKFVFESMTELEAKILTEFNNVLGKSFLPLIVDESRQNTKQNFKYNLLFYLKSPSEKIGKLIISIPAFLVEPQEVEITEYDVDIDEFAKSTTIVDIIVGTSKTTLQELKQLEKDDIVVLDDSRLNKMVLKINGESKIIRVNPDPALIVNIDDEGNTMNTGITKDMWDTIQVEIGAEFEKVKITLGELKQISEGLVVDIGSVYENKVDLKVEEKVIASGELVIINDRYGIRIDAVNRDEKNTAETNVNTHAEIYEEEPVMDDGAVDDFEDDENFDDEGGDEQFDYSDFDVDDEDI